MHHHLRTLAYLPLAASALALAVSSQAQAAVDETIVVRGTRLDPELARERAVDFVKRTGVATGQKQVARWVVPICIKVIGLQDDQAARVDRIMHGIAREANIRVAGPTCKPNITVSFAPDAGQIVRQIHARKPHQLRELSVIEREQLLNGNASVRWWYATQMLDRNGVKSNNISPGWIGAGEGSGVPGSAVTDAVSVGGSGDITSTQQFNSGSNVRTPTVRSLFGATVIVDTPKIDAIALDSIAAYAAMVSFAELDADAPPPDSILGLFQPNSIENSLTDWDLAFLKSLYRMPLDRRSRIQRGHLVKALVEERLPGGKSTRSSN